MFFYPYWGFNRCWILRINYNSHRVLEFYIEDGCCVILNIMWWNYQKSKALDTHYRICSVESSLFFFINNARLKCSKSWANWWGWWNSIHLITFLFFTFISNWSIFLFVVSFTSYNVIANALHFYFVGPSSCCTSLEDNINIISNLSYSWQDILISHTLTLERSILIINNKVT